MGEIRIKIKERIKSFYYDYIYDTVYSIYYSILDLLKGFVDLIKELKKPKTWVLILYVVLFLAVYYQKTEWVGYIALAVAIIYFLMQKKDGAYKHKLYNNAVKYNNKYLLNKFYEKYCIKQKYKKQPVKQYSDWYEEELKKLKINKN